MNKAREFDQSVVAELKALLGERVSHLRGGARAPRQGRVLLPLRAARCGGLPEDDRGSARHRQHLPPPPRADDPLRRRHLARGPHPRGAGRRVHRPVADEPGARGARGRPRRGGAGRRDAQAAERAHQAHGPVLPGRPGRRRHARRHGGDARLGHQRRALRHDARERAVAEGGAGRRPHHPDLAPREEIRRGLRPDAALRRLRRHARHHHRGDGAPVPGAGGDVGRGVRLRHGRRLHQHRDPDHPGRASRSRAATSSARRPSARSTSTRRRATASRRPCSSSFTASTSVGRRAGARRCRRSPRSTAAWTSSGRPSPRSAPSSGRRATTPTSPACRSGPARARCRPTSACRSRASPSACTRPWRT